MTDMGKANVGEWLQERYDRAMAKASGADCATAELPQNVKDWVSEIVELAEFCVEEAD